MMKKLFPEMRLCTVNLPEKFPLDTSENIFMSGAQSYFHSFLDPGFPRDYQVERGELQQSIGGMQVRSHNSGRDEIVTMERIRRYRELKKEAKQRKQNVLFWISAVSILFIFALSCILFQTNRHEYSSIFNEYFNPSEIFQHSLALTNRDNPIWLSSYEACKNGDYVLAHQILQNIPSSSAMYEKAGFTDGICLMSVNDFQGALARFGSIYGKSEYFPGAQWYSALCYLKTGEINAARLLFEQISGSHSGFEKKAREILQKLNGVL